MKIIRYILGTITLIVVMPCVLAVVLLCVVGMLIGYMVLCAGEVADGLMNRNK